MDRILELGERVVNLDTGEVVGVGVLRPLERALLVYLADRPDQLVSVDELHREVWGHAPRVLSRAAYTTISRLRALIETDPTRPRFLLAERAAGYRLHGAHRPGDGPPSRGSLPAERDGFVGRHRELSTLAERFEGHARQVTLLGPGGCGKTRLAVHYGWIHQHRWPGGVWFCDLSSTRSVQGVSAAVAASFEVALQTSDPVTRIGALLASRAEALVILDNFEGVAEHAEATLGRWLDRAPRVSFLVTSRERLGLAGEHLERLDPLGTEDARDLFVLRAEAARRGWAPDVAEQGLVDELVGLLDRLPLAIELAAARIRSMGVDEVLARMSDRARLLVAGGRRADRHATLWSVLDASWDLLDPDQQSALAQLSVFAGGFDGPAAAAVLAVASDPILALQALVDRSLVQVGAVGRRHLLMSVRDYLEQRPEQGAARWEAELRHGRYYASFGTEEAILDMWMGRRPYPVDDEANLAVACERAMARGDCGTAVGTLRTLWAMLMSKGPYNDVVTLSEGILGMAGLSVLELAVAYDVSAGVNLRVGRNVVAQERYRMSAQLAREAGQLRLAGAALSKLAVVDAMQLEFASADAHLDEAEACYRRLPDGDAHSHTVRLNRALIRMHEHPHESVRQLEELLIVFGDRAAPAEQASVRGNLGTAYLQVGRHAEAEALLREAVLQYRSTGNRSSEVNSRSNLALALYALGRTDEAVEQFHEALRVCRQVGHRAGEAEVLRLMGEQARLAGEWVEARARFEEALAIHREVANGPLEADIAERIASLTSSSR